jgi:hypothetical protein
MPLTDRLPSMGSAVDIVVVLLLLPVRGAQWLWRQLAGTASNWMSLLGERDFFAGRARGWVAMTIISPLQYYAKMFRWAVFGEPKQQMWAAAALGLTLVVASFGFLTIVAVVVFGPLLVVSLLRQVPVINNSYTRVSGGLEQRTAGSTTWIRDD